MKAGVLIDTWKAPTFRKHLKKDGFVVEECGEVCGGAILLRVETVSAEALKPTIDRAYAECRKARMH